MIDSLKRFWRERPLLAILLIALLPRLVAVVYSKGYAMHDDHFGPIEQPFIIMHYPEYWVDRAGVFGHSIVYPAIHYALFNGLEAIGIQDPQSTMYVVRFLHALYSLLIVYFGFKIAEVLSNRDTARKVGLILALFWALPFLSVRNLIEVVCIPPLMAGSYYVLISEDRLKNAFIAGLWLGLAFVFRYQTLSFTGTLGLVLFFQKRYKAMTVVAAGFLVTALIIQGSADVFAWGYPFASFIEYVRYNATHSEDYTTGPWYNYTLLALGAFIPPLSFFLLYGFLKNWKKTIILLAPLLVFFALHSSFPNKQERFILPVIPLLLVLSVVGWEEYVKGSDFWARHRAVLKGMWVWFWAVNILLLLPFSVYYCKKTRVEAMYSLYGKPVTAIFQAGGKDGVTEPPFFYGGKYPVLMADISSEQQLEYTKSQFAFSPVRANYILFYGSDDYQERINRIERTLGLTMVLQNKFDPSSLDYVFYRLNPRHNKNETIYVFKALYH
jgi:hypothetical protein